MNEEENIVTENIEEPEFTDKGEQQALPPKPKVVRVPAGSYRVRTRSLKHPFCVV